MTPDMNKYKQNKKIKTTKKKPHVNKILEALIKLNQLY